MSAVPSLISGMLLAAAASAVCSAQTFGIGSPESAAKVLSLTGQVSVLKDSEPWALQVGSVVNARQMIVSGNDGYAKFQVFDGSTFEVYPNSRVIFRANPGNWKDILDVALGRVKLHVQKLTGGRPNNQRVQTPTAVISVRGTTFDVSVEDEDVTLVSVEEGQVAVQHAILPVGDPRLLNAGEYIRVYRNQPLAEKVVDKGGIIQGALRAATEAVYRAIYRNPQVPAGRTPLPSPGGGAPGGTPGDTGGAEPPPPPPPPPND